MIQKDVDRTFAELRIFKLISTRQDLIEILYVWSLEHSEYGYQQGMNEILGVIYALLLLDYSQVQGSQEFEQLHDIKEIKADCYLIYSKIVEYGVKDFFYRESDENQGLDKRCNFIIDELL